MQHSAKTHTINLPSSRRHEYNVAIALQAASLTAQSSTPARTNCLQPDILPLKALSIATCNCTRRCLLNCYMASTPHHAAVISCHLSILHTASPSCCFCRQPLLQDWQAAASATTRWHTQQCLARGSVAALCPFTCASADS